MKNTLGLLLALLGFAGFGATYSDPVMVSSNGTLQAPTNFFTANAAGMSNALVASGFTSGSGSVGLGTNAFVNGVLHQPLKLTNDFAATGGVIFITNASGEVTAYATNLPAASGGNASTNQTQAWAAANTQTFLGPVYFGTTNAVTELAGKQNADAQLDVVANLTSGTATNFLAGDGTFKQVTTNMVPGLVADILAAAAAGGGGDVTAAGTNAFTGSNSFAGTTTFNGAVDLNGATTVSNLTVPGTLTASSLSLLTPIGVTAVGTNAAAARTQLGLVIGYDVQAYDANLAQLAAVGWASGDMPWFDGSNLTNLVTTAAGRALLTAANAAAQWDAIKSDALQAGDYDSGTWNGVTNKAITPDQFRDVIVALPGGSNAIATVTAPLYLSNNVLWIDTDGLGGGSSGYTYLLTNSVGAFQSRTASTNWVILSTTVSSNYSPAATGKFIEGGYGLVLSNNSGTSGNLNMRIKANGTTVFQDAPAAITTGTLRAAAEDFRIVRESDTTASIVSVGAYVNPAASIGLGDFGGASPLGNAKVITNIAWNWATNNTIEMSVDCDTSTSTNDALGMTVVQAFLRAEGAGFSDGTDDGVAGGSTGVEGVAITNINFRSSYAARASVTAVTNVDWLPQPPTTTSATSLTPAFGSSRAHEFTLTGAATLNAPSGITSDMVGDTFRLVFIQDSTGNRTLTVATNYLFGTDITGITLTTNAGARDYAVVYVRRTNALDVVGFVRGYAQ